MRESLEKSKKEHGKHEKKAEHHEVEKHKTPPRKVRNSIMPSKSPIA